jgi:fructose-bisphosphate aldolase class I
VLLDGSHSAERSEQVHEDTLEALFHEIERHGVSLEHVILKASMVVSGKENPKQAPVQEVAERTLRVLKRTVPAALPGVVFLSGGQTDENATAHLDAMNRMGPNPWPLTFSYSRALQAVALKAWKDQAGNVAAAQKAFHHRARMNSLAAKGQWTSGVEKAAA